MVEVATQGTTAVSVSEFLASVVSVSGAGEEKIRVGGGDFEEAVVFFDLVKGGLESDGENGRTFVETDTKSVDAFATDVTNIIRKITPKSLLFVAIKTADDDTLGALDVGDSSGLFAREREDVGKIKSAPFKRKFVIRSEASVNEAGDVETVILTVLAPGVGFDVGVAKNLFATLIGDWRETEGRGGRGRSGSRLSWGGARSRSGFWLRVVLDDRLCRGGTSGFGHERHSVDGGWCRSSGDGCRGAIGDAGLWTMCDWVFVDLHSARGGRGLGVELWGFWNLSRSSWSGRNIR